MKRLVPFVLSVLFVSSAFAAAPPNIVLFLADDLGWTDVTWHGSTYKMPHLDKLAREGVKLESHYVHPMCSPTRAALMAGRCASRFGVTAAQNPRVLPWNTVTLARALQTAGYETCITGKWHLGSKPVERMSLVGQPNFAPGYKFIASEVFNRNIEELAEYSTATAGK